ncbi:MAG TPA: metal ABC transporter permease [Tepidisphaeraceae bacterium]|jgi:ABC-type Mn2+/Zn2+ transport system permease subunit|nr:metal ABC transporter permease [Tepidisphaeraceae bacterium]
MTWIFINTISTAAALATACAVLSVIVVLRRWAFIGEGISHSGFGGAGTAWLLMLVIPALNQSWVPYASVVIFCIATAIAIGAISRRGGVQADAAIGIFLVASLAWGFLAQQIYTQVRHGAVPTLFENLLFGQMVMLSIQYTRAAIVVCLIVVLIVAVLWKEIISYSFDPLLAETAGVRAGFIHFLLMTLIAIVIVIGIRVAGSVLVTAFLVLPGATALLLSRKLQFVLTISIFVAMIGSVCGMMINLRWSFLPAGPLIVLIMFGEFFVAYGTTKLIRQPAWT